MNKNLIIFLVFSALVISAFYWYFNYRVGKTIPYESAEETEIEEPSNENTQSIELEKPPFLK